MHSRGAVRGQRPLGIVPHLVCLTGTANELAMDLLVAEAVLEFGTSLREAGDGAMQWARDRGVAPLA